MLAWLGILRWESTLCMKKVVRALKPEQHNRRRWSVVGKQTTVQVSTKLGVNQATVSRWQSDLHRQQSRATATCTCQH
jgi:hypothetical protein